jgi:hypothetical protein
MDNVTDAYFFTVFGVGGGRTLLQKGSIPHHVSASFLSNIDIAAECRFRIAWETEVWNL